MDDLTLHRPAGGAGGPAPAALVDLVRAWGRDTVSFQSLEPNLVQYRDPALPGAVAYLDTGSAWVSAGAPLAPPDRRPELVRSFLAAARLSDRRACFCAVEGNFDPGQRLSSVGIGAQPVWDPGAWPETLKEVRSLREQLRRARAKGVTVRLAQPRELERGQKTRAQLELLTRRWLHGRKGPPLRFLLELHLFHFPKQRRLFLAEAGGDLLGALAAVPVFARNGWFFEDILRDPRAPNGTTELLIHAGMTRAHEEGSARVTLGLVPLAGDELWPRVLRRVGAFLYDFEGLWRYRVKLRPHAWEPVRICYPETQSAVEALWDVATAVTGGPVGFIREALRKTRPPGRAERRRGAP